MKYEFDKRHHENRSDDRDRIRCGIAHRHLRDCLRIVARCFLQNLLRGTQSGCTRHGARHNADQLVDARLIAIEKIDRKQDDEVQQYDKDGQNVEANT